MSADIERARAALFAIPPGLPRDEWHEIGRAAIAAGLTVDDVNTWSEPADNYKGRRDVESAFRTIKPNGKTTAGTLFHFAKLHGWTDAERPHNGAKRAAAAPIPQGKAQHNPVVTWDACGPATAAHGYIDRKLGLPDGLRGYSGPLTIAGQACDGALVLPARTLAGELCTLQFIPSEGKKVFLPSVRLAPDACFIVGGTLDKAERIFVCEGIGQAWSAHQATRAPAVVTFGAGRMAGVSRALRDKYPSALLVLVADRGKEMQCAAIAADVRGQFVELPADKPQNYDLNDFHRDLRDLRAVAELLESPKAPPIPLGVIFADELPDNFTPPDEVVEGVLTAGDGSVLYGDSNSGKTFMVIDLAAAVARGVLWLGKHTEPGLVVYLAVESPASVRRRLQAYQKHHGVKVPNFAIVQSPIDLFDGDADTDKLIEVVHQIEKQKGQPARLIVGDTLARLSAGANENAGQDMGLVVRRFDRIRTECRAHFLLIHHSGKNAAAGSRGWSGVRAAVDTEIEVTDSPTGRCCEIMKQRDLSTKGDRIGFRLDPVTLGFTKWGKPATSCVVVSADAPEKPKGKRMGEVEGAVVEFLTAQKVGIKKSEVVKHFEGRYEKGPVYRAMKALVTAAIVNEAVGIVSLSGGAT